MSWQILIGISVITFSVSTVLQKVLLKDRGVSPIAFSIFFQILTGTFITLTGLLFFDMGVSFTNPKIFLNLISSIIIYVIYNVSVYRAIQQLEASRFAIIFSVRVFFVILVSSLALGETLSGRQLVGTLLIFVAVVLTNFQRSKLKLGRGELFALVAALCIGFANPNDSYILKNMNLYPYLSFAFIVIGVFTAFIYPKEIGNIRTFLDKKMLSLMILTCLIFAASSITFYMALQIGNNTAKIVSVNLTSVLITTVLAIIFLKETDGWIKKLAGAVLSFVGLLFLV